MARGGRSFPFRNRSLFQRVIAPPVVGTDYVDSATVTLTLTPSPAIVHSGHWDNRAANLTTLAVSPAAVGGVMVLAINLNNGTTTINSVSGGGVTSWTRVTTDLGDQAGHRDELWVGTVTAAGAATITITLSDALPTVEMSCDNFTSYDGAPNDWTAYGASHLFTASSNTVTWPSVVTPDTTLPMLYAGYAGLGGSTSIGTVPFTPGFTYGATGFNNYYVWGTELTPSATVQPSAQQSALSYSRALGVVLIAGKVATLDAATVSLTLTPGATDTEQAVDTGSVTISATPSAVETAQFVDSATVSLALTPSSSDTYTPGAVVYTDANTATIILTPSATDLHTITDAGTASLIVTPSATDTAQFVDAVTTTIALTPSATDLHTITDAGTVSLAVTPSAADIAQFVDANTASVLITPSSVNTAQLVDANTVLLAITPSVSDIAAFVDSTSVPVTITPSSTDIYSKQYLDSNTVSVLISPSASDIAQFVDSNTASLIVTPSSSDVAQLVDSNTARVTITPSETDVFAGIDSATVSLALTASSFDVFTATDTNTVPLVMTVTPTDVAQFVDTGSAYLAIVASSIDIRERFDANTVSMTLTPSETDVAQFVDTGTATVVLTPSSTDIREQFDSATASLVLSPSFSDVLSAVDSDSAYVTLTPSALDEFTPSGDFATATILLTPSSSDVAGFVDIGSVIVVVDLSGADVTGMVDSNTAVVTLTPSSADVAQTFDSATVTLVISPSSFDSQSESLTNVATSTQTIDEDIHAYLVPVSDIAIGTWHDTPLYEKVDEYTPDAADYIESGNNPVNDTAELALQAGSDPNSSDDHFINIQLYKNESAPSTLDLTIRLKEGSNVITEQVLSDISSSLTTLKIPLTTAEIDSISDYTNLSFELVANEVT